MLMLTIIYVFGCELVAPAGDVLSTLVRIVELAHK